MGMTREELTKERAAGWDSHRQAMLEMFSREELTRRVDRCLDMYSTLLCSGQCRYWESGHRAPCQMRALTDGIVDAVLGDGK